MPRSKDRANLGLGRLWLQGLKGGGLCNSYIVHMLRYQVQVCSDAGLGLESIIISFDFLQATLFCSKRKPKLGIAVVVASGSIVLQVQQVLHRWLELLGLRLIRSIMFKSIHRIASSFGFLISIWQVDDFRGRWVPALNLPSGAICDLVFAVLRIGLKRKVIVAKMAFHSKRKDGRGVVIADLLLLSVVPHTALNVTTTTAAPKSPRCFEANDENAKMQLGSSFAKCMNIVIAIPAAVDGRVKVWRDPDVLALALAHGVKKESARIREPRALLSSCAAV